MDFDESNSETCAISNKDKYSKILRTLIFSSGCIEIVLLGLYFQYGYAIFKKRFIEKIYIDNTKYLYAAILYILTYFVVCCTLYVKTTNIQFYIFIALNIFPLFYPFFNVNRTITTWTNLRQTQRLSFWLHIVRFLLPVLAAALITLCCFGALAL